jgi:predicted molibdopterin-dependent oxidoreductase YjgC
MLSNVHMVIAIQTYRSAITDRAAVALPMATYVEEDGTICNFEGHVQRCWKVFDPRDGSRPLLRILADLAARWEVLGAPADAEACFEELAREVPYFQGLSYSLLGQTGVNPARHAATVAAPQRDAR